MMAWGKCDREDIGSVHLLEHHCADVASCFEALLARDTFHRALANAADRDWLSESIIAKLTCLVFLHDFGKLNSGFQYQVRADNEKPKSSEGHINEALTVLLNEFDLAEEIMKNLRLYDLNETCGEAFCPLLLASLSHHGNPVICEKIRGRRIQKAWQAHNGYDPVQQAKYFGNIAQQWYPEAFVKGDVLPDKNEFQHAFAGAVSLVDWLGSDETMFSFESSSNDRYIDRAREKAEFAVRNCLFSGFESGQARDKGKFKDVFRFAPNKMQQCMSEITSDKQLLILEAETGSGKTEAAFERFRKLYEDNKVDGMYFALPTRTAATQIHKRINNAVKAFFKTSTPETVLAVPGYLKAGSVGGKHLPGWQVQWDDNNDQEFRALRWAAENAKRFLSAQIAVGTVDQAMLAAMQVKHSHLRAYSLARNLLVIDEVHASDVYMRGIIHNLLQNHARLGGHALLMSATLGSDARRSWLLGIREARMSATSVVSEIDKPYPSVSYCDTGNIEKIATVQRSGKEKIVNVKMSWRMEGHREIASEAMSSAAQGAKVLIIRNTVKYAVRTQEALEEQARASGGSEFLFNVKGVRTLHHGRFGLEDRVCLDNQIEVNFGKTQSDGGLVAVGTQTLEQSLDIDADYLITDVCPVDVLLQRIGRLHRHDRTNRPEKYKTPVCCVLMPEDGVDNLLRNAENGLGMNRDGNGIYPDLRCVEAVRKLAESYTEWRIPAMSRMLVEKGTKNSELDKIAERKGDAWQKISEKVIGLDMASGSSASFAILRWSGCFTELEGFGDQEAKIRTRLGEEGPALKFDPPFASPFDQKVSRIVVPAWMSSESLVDELLSKRQPAVQQLEFADKSYIISLGDKSFHYSRMGLSEKSGRHN